MSRAIGRVLLLLVTTSACLVGVEAAVRFFQIGPDIAPVHRENFQLSPNTALRYELVPGSPDGAAKISSQGLRDREYPILKPPGTFRIATIGDSVSFGHGVAQQEAFPEILEQVLQRHFAKPGRQFEVLNFAVTGYGVTQIAESLRAKALAFDPDLVIYGYCLNDPQAFSLEFESLLSKTTSAERSFLEGAPISPLRVAALVRYLLHSRTHDGQRRGELPRWYRDDPQFLAIGRGTPARYHRWLYRDPAATTRLRVALDSLAEAAGTQDVPVVLVLFPLLLELDNYALAPEHAMITALAADRSIAGIDLLPVFQALPHSELDRYRIDPVHPSQRGHRLAALAILYELLSGGWLPGSDVAEFERLHDGSQAARQLSRTLEKVAQR